MNCPDGTSADRRTILGAIGALAASPCLPFAAVAEKPAEALRVTSPGGTITVTLIVPTPDAPPMWRASAYGRDVMKLAPLGLRADDGRLLGPGARLLGTQVSSRRGRWHPPYSTAASHDEGTNNLVARFYDAARDISFSIALRAHDHGFGLRYRIDAAPGGAVDIHGEDTHFAFPESTIVWSSRDEGIYTATTAATIDPVPDPPLSRSSDPGPLADLPLTAILPNGLAASIAEADRLDYPRLGFRPAGENAVASCLLQFPARATGWSGPGDTPPEPIFRLAAGTWTPWRLVTVARGEPELAERAGLPAIFATPSRIRDTGWLRPGKAIRARVPYSTERAMEVVTFARARGLDHVLFDAHWYGDGTDASDAITPVPGLDIRAVIARAKAQGIGVFLYVDREPAMRQLDAILFTYRAWGVAGIKFGFMWEGRQRDTRFINYLVAACAKAGLMVSLHDDLRPAGLERTYPNYLTLEGVRGNEHFPTASHNVTLPFTRCVAGPIDYTICYAQDRNSTTNAHQLAMAVVYYSPLTLLYWYDDVGKYASGAWPELAFFDRCPTVWDETRTLSGAIAKHVVTARRSGRSWFLGAMTNEQGRRLSIGLDFLGPGRWTADIYRDGAPAAEPRHTPVEIDRRTVDRGQMLEITLAPSGGQAVIFSPA